MAGLELDEELTQKIDSILPKEVKEQLDNHILKTSEELTSWKSKFEKQRVNSEQQYFDLEKQLITTVGKLESESNQKTSLQDKFNELETKHKVTTEKLDELQKNREAFQTSEFEYKSNIHILETEKRDLSILSTKRTKEIDRLNEEIKELSNKVTASNNEKCEAQAKLSEAQSEEVSREYREKRLEREKEQLEKQVEWFNDQLTEKTSQLHSVRKERTSQVLEVQAHLDEKTQELEHVQALVDSLKGQQEEQNSRIESLNQKLKDERDGQVALDEQWRQELGTQQRLTGLYKASAEENDSKITELTGAVEELRRLLKDAAAAYTGLEAAKGDEVNKLTVMLKDKEETLTKLDQELRSANQLMVALKKGAITLTEDAVESLSPAAAATSRLLKSGMSLTQIYNEYVQATDALSTEREENRKLQSYLDQIVQEIEEKAPILKKQKEDYETSLTNLEQMTRQIDSTMLECEKLRADADDMRRRFGHVQRECGKHQQTSQDLSRQVQHLLKEVEELRGGRVVRDDLDVSSSEVSSSCNIISEKLVTFRSISEMQQQNQRLIEVARDLSDKKETEEAEATTEKTRELKDQLEFALRELDNFREARSRQAEMVESIVRQRDMYRVLLQQGPTGPEVPSLAPMTSTPMQPSSQARTPVSGRGTQAMSPQQDAALKREVESSRAALKEMKGEFEAYKRDKADNDKVQNELLEKARKNASDMRVANTKLSTQLEFATERYKILQNNATGYKREIELYQDRNNKSSSIILRHESAVATLKEDLVNAQENIARWQVQTENLKKERELLKNCERRLSMELDSVRREQTSQTMLLASLQAIQTNQERAEFGQTTRHTHQLEGLNAELANLRRRLEASLEEKAKQSSQWEDIVKTVHLEIKHEKDKQQALKTKSDNAVAELETVKSDLATSEAKLAAAEQKLVNLATRSEENDDEATSVESRVETEALKDLKNQIAQQSMVVKSLKQQLEASKKNASQFKAIADGVEQSLKDQSTASKEVQAACERKLTSAASEAASMAERLRLIEGDLDQANAETLRLTQESQSLHGDLRTQVTKLQTQLEEAVTQRDTAMHNSELAQADLKEQAELSSQAQDRYQRELMLHSADVQALQAVKKQLEDQNEHLQQSQEETTMFEKQLMDAKTSWGEQERVLKEEVMMLETRVSELTNQNTMLHSQMTQLSDQVVSIQNTSRRDSIGGDTSFSEESGKSSEQLLEVVKFLRREKDIAETKLKAVDAECKRFKQRFSHVEKQAEEATKALAEERQRSQVNVETVANQVELMRKVASLNVLTDSNKLLRDERDQLLNTRQETEAKLAKLERDIEPLQAKLRDLESTKDTLTVEKNTLQDEVNRWKNRTDTLIDKSHKTDPEEQKRLLTERENLRKALVAAKEESFKHKAELDRLNTAHTGLQQEAANLKQEATKTGQELTSVKRQVEEKGKDSEEKAMTINKLKQIGRKYKEQAEKVSKELEDVKVKAAGQESHKVSMATLEQTIAELRQTLADNSSKVSGLEAQLTEAQAEGQGSVKHAEQAVAEGNTLRESLGKQQQELAKTIETNTRLKAEVDDFEKRASEFEKKQAQSKQVLQTARNKMVNQKADMEKLERENTELKASMAAVQGGDHGAVKAQYESRVHRLEGDLEEMRKSGIQAQGQIERLQGDNSDLQVKISQLTRQLEASHHKPSPPHHGVPHQPVAANIKPMASASASTRPGQAITSHSPAAVRATASIRPMAISPSMPPSGPSTTTAPSSGTPTATVSGTPTATVMPTTATQHGDTQDDMPGPSGLQHPQASTPSTITQHGSVTQASVTGRVQIVEPQVQDHSGPSDSTPEDQTQTQASQGQATAGSNQAVVPPMETVGVVTPVPSRDQDQHIAGGSQHIAGGSQHASGSQQHASGSQQHASGSGQHTTGIALGKRVRSEDETFQQDEQESKRTRISNQDQHAIPTINIIDENQQVVTQIQPHSGSQSAGPSLAHPHPSSQSKAQVKTHPQPIGQSRPTAAATPSMQGDWQGEATTEPEEEMAPGTQIQQQRQQGDDIIMVLSDEDDQQPEDNDQIDEDEDEEEEEEEDDYEEEEDEDEEEEEEEEADEEEDEEEIQTLDADEVVIIDTDQSPSAPSAPQQLAPLAPPPGRTQPLGGFMMAGSGNPFEEDDSLVPSTPTLSRPRRADGFAEALNSPAVAQRFVFGSTESVNNPDMAQLESQRALGMDDTRMDLSQFDEGRSAPSTPTPVTPHPDSGSLEEGGAAVGEDMGDGQGVGSSMAEDEELEELQGDVDEGEDVGGDEDTQQAKPQIKKIVWDQSGPAPGSSGAAPAPPSSISPLLPAPGVAPVAQRGGPRSRRAQGLRTGGPSRGRGAHFGGQAQGAGRGYSGGARGREGGPARGRGWKGGFRGQQQ